jgi:hypothetical protein
MSDQEEEVVIDEKEEFWDNEGPEDEQAENVHGDEP